MMVLRAFWGRWAKTGPIKDKISEKVIASKGFDDYHDVFGNRVD